MIRGEHGIQFMPCSSKIISEVLPKINTMEKCDFVKSLILFQNFNSPFDMMLCFKIPRAYCRAIALS